MNNLPDKDIDYIFQEGSADHDFDFKPSAWDKMEGLLDKEVQKRKRKKGLIIFLFFTASLGILCLTYHRISSNEVQYKKLETQQRIIADNSNNENTTLKNDEQTIITKELNENKLQIETIDKPTITKKNNTIKEASNITIFTPHDNEVLYKKSEKPLDKHSSKPDNTINLNDYTKFNSTGSITTESINEMDNPKKPISSTAIELLDLDPLVYHENSDEKELPKLSDVKARNDKFRLGFLLAREWSSVGMMNQSKSGYKVGLELAYQFKSKYQLTTGFNLSKKKFTTSGTNYEAAEEKWVDEIVPMAVDGSCDVIELPLKLSFYHKGYDNSTFFVSGGLTNYFMRKEWYDYEYEPEFELRTDLPRYWTNEPNEPTNKHFFGVSTFSIGYQHILNKSTAIQFSPYVQIPFTGIGDGRVKLITTGIQMNMLFGR